MATNIVLKRSATADAAPTTSDLELGELALNTYDGKLYMKKTVSGSSSIVNLSGTVAPSSSAFSHTTYKYTATSSQTTFTGSDANSTTLAYTVGQIQVFLNGILLDVSDYTASNGTSVVLGSGASTGSILLITSFEGTNPFDYFKYVASSNQTSFSGNDANSESLLYTVGNIAVYLNGVLLDASDITASSGTSVVLGSGATSGDILTIWEFNEAAPGDVASDTSPQLGGDLDVNGNDIVSTSNTHINVIPHGTGNVTLQTDTLQLGSSAENVIVTTNSTGDLTLNTNSGTNSGSIVIADGANNNITFTPNGSGNVVLDNHTWPNADGSASQVLQTNGSGVLSFTTISSAAITDADNDTKIQVEEGSDDDTIRFDISGTEQIVLVDGVLKPTTDNDIDLGTSSLEFKDAFFDGTVTSDAFAGPLTGDVTGDLSGTATLATSVTVSANNSTDETVYPVFVDGATGTQGAESDTGLTYNPSSGLLTTTTVAAALTGNASTATLAATTTALATARTIGGTSFDGTANIVPGTATEATNVTVSANNSTDETVYPTFVDGASSTQGIETDTGLTYNPSSGILTATQFTGAVVGNVTGNASGTAATVTTAAQTNITSLGTLTALTVDNLGINGNTITANSGALNLTPASGSAIVLDGTISVDAGVVTGATSITSTAFVGDITGDVTGNTSGTAATVTTAAQTNITSLGTLTALTVDNLGINGNTITANSGAVNITPAAGSAIVLDGTISVDAGVVTGATSITSTAFVGALTGNASGTAATVTGATQAAITSAANLATVGTITTGVWSGTALVSAKIGNDQIDSQHYAAASIDNEHLADDAVDSDEIAAGAIDLAHMSVNSIDSDQYVDGSIDNAHIADDAIDSEHYADGSIDTAHIADDQVTAAKLANTAVTAAAYGSSTAIPVVTVDAQGRITAASTAAISSSLTVGADSGSDDTVTVGTDTLDFVGTSNEIETTVSNNQIQIGLPNNVTIAGNLTVSGDTTTVNTSTLAVEDPLVSLATGNNAADAVDIGIYGLYDTSGSQDLYGGLFRDASDSGKWKLFKDNQAAPTTTVNTSGTGYATGTLVSNLEGNVTGNVTGNTSGTAATVTTAAQSAITSLGTLTTLTVDNVLINGTTIGHTGDTDLMTLASGILTVAGDVYIGDSNKELRFYEGSNYIGFEAPALSANQIWVLPSADGSANQTLKTDGSGNLSWATAASAVSNLTDVSLSSLASNDYLRYNGSAWVNTSQGSNPVVDTMTGDNSDTTLTLTHAPLSENATLVTIDGIVQHKSTYSVSGSTLTFSTAPPTGSAVECITNVNTNILNGNDVAVDTMTGDNSDTTLSLSVTPSNENHINVYWDGVYQTKDNWSLSGTTITFDTAPGTGVKVEAVSNQMMSVGTATDLAASAISGKTLVTAVGADHLLVYDATDGALKKSLVSDVIEQATTEEVQDIAGAMFTSNTETGITATYQDGDGTIDLVVGTLNQDTTGLAATATALATARTIGGTSFDGTGNIAVATATEGTNVTVSANNSTDETVYPTFVDGATGTQGIETDTGLTYNPSTGMLTSTGLTGTLTGNVTGNVTGNTSGTAATVTGGTQASITSAANLVTVGTIGTGVWQGTAVASGYIAADAITGAKIADDAIDSEHYTDGSIDNAHLADDAVGADELAANAVVNASVASGAAIAYSKLANLTNSRALVSDGSGDVSVSAVTATELGYVDGVTSAIQTQMDTKTSTVKAIITSMVFG